MRRVIVAGAAGFMAALGIGYGAVILYGLRVGTPALLALTCGTWLVVFLAVSLAGRNDAA